MLKNLIIIISLISNIALAETKFKSPEILARTNVTESYNLPKSTYLSNVSPVINNRGEVTFKVIATGDEAVQALWVKAHQDENGKILYLAPSDRVITDPSINDEGKIAFSLFDETHSDGLFILDSQNLTVANVLDSKLNELVFYTYPTINNKNEIYFRGTDRNNIRKIFNFNGELQTLLEEGVVNSNLQSSYLFKPAINQQGDFVLKLRLGNKGAWDESNPDVIAFYNNNEKVNSLKTLVFDRDFDKQSKFISFFNNVSLSNNNLIAFTALMDDGRKAIFIQDINDEIKRIALENEDSVLNIESFSIKINSLGHLLFRGKNKANKRCLFFYDGTIVKQIVAEGDEINSDLGLARILDNQYFPGFLGEVDLNDHDQIVFGAMIQSAKDNHEFGQAIYLINPQQIL
jgi:hypothetical protein